jgi:hypothetical protein
MTNGHTQSVYAECWKRCGQSDHSGSCEQVGTGSSFFFAQSEPPPASVSADCVPPTAGCGHLQTGVLIASSSTGMAQLFLVKKILFIFFSLFLIVSLPPCILTRRLFGIRDLFEHEHEKIRTATAEYEGVQKQTIVCPTIRSAPHRSQKLKRIVVNTPISVF